MGYVIKKLRVDKLLKKQKPILKLIYERKRRAFTFKFEKTNLDKKEPGPANKAESG